MAASWGARVGGLFWTTSRSRLVLVSSAQVLLPHLVCANPICLVPFCHFENGTAAFGEAKKNIHLFPFRRFHPTGGGRFLANARPAQKHHHRSPKSQKEKLLFGTDLNLELSIFELLKFGTVVMFI